MPVYKRCKACGFIIEVGKLKEKCPACGAPATVFEDYALDIKEGRKKILDAHLHPISVHFPEGFGILLLFLGVLTFLVSSDTKLILLNSLSVIGILSPFTDISAMLLGLYDAKVRFKRTNTPYLNQKKIAGVLLIGIDVVLAVFARPSVIEIMLSVVLVFSVVHVIIAGFLGLLGGQLITAWMKN